MTWDEAIRTLSLAQMQFGMLMPIKWVKENGEGSEYFTAVRMAMDAMEQAKAREDDKR